MDEDVKRLVVAMTMTMVFHFSPVFILYFFHKLVNYQIACIPAAPHANPMLGSQQASFRSSRLAMHKQSSTSNILRRLVRQLFPRALLKTTKHQLRLQRPLQGNVPGLGGFLVGQRAVVLQVGAEAFGFERGPGGELVHGGRVLGPVGELVGVLGELGLQGLDGGGVFVE